MMQTFYWLLYNAITLVFLLGQELLVYMVLDFQITIYIGCYGRQDHVLYESFSGTK